MADGVLLLVDGSKVRCRRHDSCSGRHRNRSADHRRREQVRSADAPDEVVNEVFDLLVALEASDERLDFPVIYASGKEGWASKEVDGQGTDVTPLLDAIVEHIPCPVGYADVPLQMLITSHEYSSYVGRIAIGRIYAGALSSGQAVSICRADGSTSRARALKIFRFEDLGKSQAELISVGDSSRTGRVRDRRPVACPDGRIQSHGGG